jgi:hypothetical protein
LKIVLRPKAGPGADWFHVRGQVPRGRSRLASQATAKLFAEAHGKKVYPEHEEPRTKRLAPVVLGFSCSLRGTYPRPFHQSAPGPKCYYDTLVV